MGQRTLTARFMPGVWVFPGGAVDDADGDDGWRLAALRELAEEVGIWATTSGIHVERLPHDADVMAAARSRGWSFDVRAPRYFANWVTPAPMPIRFDTRFYALVGDAEPVVDDQELTQAVWVAPTDAVAAAQTGEWEVSFPTLQTLHDLAAFRDAADAMARMESLESVPRVEPHMSIRGGTPSVLLPGQAGFEEAAIEQADPEFLDRLRELLRSGSGGPVPEMPGP